MTLGDLIARLESADPARVVPRGFHNPHSYRGYYHDLAFEPTGPLTVGEMLAAAKSALGQTYQGYKGGDYEMGAHTDCWISEEGCVSNEPLGDLLLDYLLGQNESTVYSDVDAASSADVAAATNHFDVARNYTDGPAFAEAFAALCADPQPVLLHLSKEQAWYLFAIVQLASRHPEAAQRVVMKEAVKTARIIQSAIAPDGALARMAERGWNPSDDCISRF